MKKITIHAYPDPFEYVDPRDVSKGKNRMNKIEGADPMKDGAFRVKPSENFDKCRQRRNWGRTF